MNLRFVKNHLWRTTRQLFKKNRKVDQLSDRNNWHQLDQFPKFEMGIDIAQSSFSFSTAKVHVFCDSVLCLGKKGNNPVESWKKKQNSMVFGQQLFQ